MQMRAVQWKGVTRGKGKRHCQFVKRPPHGAGGAVAALSSDGVLRSPAFVFADMIEAGEFVAWVATQEHAIRAAVGAMMDMTELTMPMRSKGALSISSLPASSLE